MGADRLAVRLAHRLREGAEQLRLEQRIVGKLELLGGVLKHDLGQGQDHRELGPGHAAALLDAADQLLAGGEALDLAVEPAGGFEHLDRADMAGESLGPARFGDRQRQRLQAIVLEHELGDLVGHLGEQAVALFEAEPALAHLAVERDLDVHFIVRAIDAGRIVDEVGVDAPALLGELDAAGLGDAEVGALADDLGAHVLGVRPKRIVGRVADVGLALRRSLDVGADAAEPEQVDVGLQDRVDQGRRVARPGLDPEQLARFGAELDRFLGASEDPAALRDQVAVVLVPARAREVEQALAFLPARRRIGIGIDEDVTVIECGDQPDRLGQQHAVAEHVARHVAAAGDGRRVRLNVDAHFEKMALHGNPRAARGNPHLLVVVAVGTAAGEGIAEPEIALQREGIGNVGEGRRALVGGDDEIGIVAVVNDDLLRMNDLVVDEVVGDRQQRADEDAIAFRALGQPCVAVAHRRQLLGIEAALRAGRDDHRILDQLRLDQAEDLGAEVVAPVGPAEPAAGDRPAAQVDALDARAVDPDFAPRHRRRKPGHQRAVDLEGEGFRGGGREGVGPHDRLDQRAQAAKDAVVVDRPHLGERAFELLPMLLDLLLAIGRRRIVGGGEQSDQRARRAGGAAERVDDGDQAERASGLAQVAEPGAQPDHGLSVEAGIQHQLVEFVVLGDSAQHVGDRTLDLLGPRQDRADVRLRPNLDPEIVDVAETSSEAGRHFLEHAEAEIFEHRDGFGQRNQAGLAIGLQPELARPVRLSVPDPNAAVAVIVQHAQAEDVGGALFGRSARPVTFGERIDVGQREARGARRAGEIDQLGFDRGRPAADHFDNRRVERFGVGQRRFLVDILGVADEREVAIAELDRPAGDLASDLGSEQHRDRRAAPGGQLLARQPDEGEQLALEDAAHLQQAPGAAGPRATSPSSPGGEPNS